MKIPKEKEEKIIRRNKEAATYLQEFSKSISSIKLNDDFSEVIDTCIDCRGKIITSGMGKAGIIMQKFSSTLCSLGSPSCYLHPGESSHGDLGLITNKDILFIASTSGKTREVLELIELSRKIKVKKIVGITSHIDSPIREKADLVLDMGIVKETGHLHIAPTTSTLIMLAITDCVALLIAKEKGFTAEDYALRHHSGYCGSMARREERIY